MKKKKQMTKAEALGTAYAMPGTKGKPVFSGVRRKQGVNKDPGSFGACHNTPEKHAEWLAKRMGRYTPSPAAAVATPVVA